MAKVIQQYTHRKNPRIYLQERSDSRFLQAVTYLNGKTYQRSMKTDQLGTAEKLSAEWFKLLHKAERGAALERLGEVPTMSQLYEEWEKESMPPKKLAWIQMKWSPVKAFWKAIQVTDINAATFKDFYRWRRTGTTRKGTKLKNHTLHKDVIFLRQLLKYALEEEHIDVLPPIPKVGRIETNPRPWLTRDEWTLLSVISQDRIKEAENVRLRAQRQDLRDQMIWIVASLMRIGEMLELRFRDCEVEAQGKKGQRLMCRVYGKRGHRTVVAPQECVDIWKRRKKGRADSDLMFPVHHREAFRELLDYTELRTDPQTGEQRNFKSLRATGISLRILASDHPNLLLISRNAGTSLQMIDQFYAKRLGAEHGKDALGESLNLDEAW